MEDTGQGPEDWADTRVTTRSLDGDVLTLLGARRSTRSCRPARVDPLEHFDIRFRYH